jgi:hypothetical protein
MVAQRMETHDVGSVFLGTAPRGSLSEPDEFSREA